MSRSLFSLSSNSRASWWSQCCTYSHTRAWASWTGTYRHQSQIHQIHLLFCSQTGLPRKVLAAADGFGKLSGIHRLKLDPSAHVVQPRPDGQKKFPHFSINEFPQLFQQSFMITGKVNLESLYRDKMSIHKEKFLLEMVWNCGNQKKKKLEFWSVKSLTETVLFN